jgi:hypothetical protein
MSRPPIDQAEFWIRFGCGFLFFGMICALLGLRVVDSAGLIPTLAGCVILSSAMSFYVARIGDEGWRKLAAFLFWW